ncbi:YcxB family protein [Streptomyces sp. NPDC059525]|uniref:YcxB family protein n=1 Tax=Streptomyces sp. NPDC059525 TaxID=3346857 RepID=UPI003673A6D4
MQTGGDTSSTSSTGSTGGTIEFVYDPTPEDYRTAFWRFNFGTWPGRGNLMTGPFVGIGLGILLSWLRRFSENQTAFVLVAVTLAMCVIVPRVGARKAREQYQDMEEYGTCRTTVTEEGLTTTGGELSSTIEWRVFPWYFETDTLFVVMTKRTGIFFALPKRGAQDPADVDRVRAVLDRNLKRL